MLTVCANKVHFSAFTATLKPEFEALFSGSLRSVKVVFITLI